jgi:peptidoglycan/xylan/chitin deacetylase (PgdA/CDA1 family)
VELRRRYVPDPYIKALFDAETTGAALQDAGIRHIAARARGIGLTADLCPSKRDLDRSFFIDIVKTLRKEKAPVPLALAVTGLWMEEHPDDFCWLMDLMDSGHIAITWINHSFHHRIGSGSDLTQNFLLKKGTNVEQEILKTEKLLLESGALPSVFFRFPGLVSNDSLVRLVVSYGLIPVGCDAWLAKDQRPTDGSIVLVHANGNEPEGIERMRKILREEQPNIDARRWVLLDLKESVAETEEESYEEPPGGPPDRKLSVAPPVARDTIEDTELAE